jgi:hypothetical protein
MNTTTFAASDLHQMTIDAMVFVSHLTPTMVLSALIAVMLAGYLLTKEKSTLVVVLTATLYLLPFLITGRTP